MGPITPGTIEARVLAEAISNHIDMVENLFSDDEGMRDYQKATGVPLSTGIIILRGILAGTGLQATPRPYLTVHASNGDFRATGPQEAVEAIFERYSQMSGREMHGVISTVRELTAPAAKVEAPVVVPRRVIPGKPRAIDKTSKFCNDCGKEQPIDRFNKNKAASDGRQSYCKFHQAERSKKGRRTAAPINASAIESEPMAKSVQFEPVAEPAAEPVAEPVFSPPPAVELPPVSVEPILPAEEQEPPKKWAYSRPCRCPKCGAGMVRLKARPGFDPMRDVWLHDRGIEQTTCIVKMVHHKDIKVDHTYGGQ